MLGRRDKSGVTTIKKIIFVNRYFFPDVSATSQMVSDLAFHLASRGDGGDFQVEVVTSRQEYGSAGAQLPAAERIRGVRIWRVWTSRFGRHNLAGRAVDYLTFYLSATWRLFRRTRRGDVIVAKTDPPLISVPAYIVTRIRRAALVNWTQDLFPEVALALGMNALRFAEPILRGLRNLSLRGARCNVVLGTRMATIVAAQGVPADRIAVIHNWSDDDHVRPVDRAVNPLRDDWGLTNKFVVGYSGNMGRAHDFETIIEAAVALKEIDNIRFLFIGGGAQRDRIGEVVRHRRLDNVLFQPYQPRDKLPLSLGAADVHLISLRPPLEGLIVPSKFYGIAAAGRPTLYIGDPKGEIPALLTTAACGYTIQPGDAAELSRHILRLSDEPEIRDRLGRNARSLCDREVSKSNAFAKWEDVLKNVG